MPHDAPFIGPLRVRDWIRLLDFEPAPTVYGGYALPIARHEWLARSQRLMERAGDRWWPVCGAFFLMTAVKRVRGMRLVGPVWRSLSPRTATMPAATSREVSCREHPSGTRSRMPALPAQRLAGTRPGPAREHTSS